MIRFMRGKECVFLVMLLEWGTTSQHVVLPSLVAAEDDAAQNRATQQFAVALGFQKKRLYPQAISRWSKFLTAFPKDKRIANAHYHMGVCQYQSQQFVDAAKTFQLVVAKYAQFAQRDGAQFNLGLVHYSQAAKANDPKLYMQSAQTFAQLVTQFPKSQHVADALYYQAECLYSGGDKAKAVPIYNRVITEFSASAVAPDAYYGLGTVYQELEQFAEAAKIYEGFNQKFPQSDQINECRLRLGVVKLKLKQYPQAESLFQQLTNLADFPFADYALLMHAESKLQQEQLADAGGLYESLPQRFAASSYKSVALLAAGKARYRAQQFAQAQTNLTTVADAKSAESPEAAYWLGRTLLQLKQAPAALARLDAAIPAAAQSEHLPHLRFARIDAIYEIADRRKETVGLYENFAKQHAEHALAADAQYRSALTALQLTEYGPARANAEAFVQQQKWAQHALLPDALFVAAESCLLTTPADYKAAEAHYRRLATDFPTHAQSPVAGVRIGFCLYSTKQLDQSIAHLTPLAATLKAPEHKAETQLLIGRCHADSQRHGPAVTALKAALATAPQWTRADEVRLALATSLQSNQDVAGAINELQQLITAHTNSPYLDQAFYQLGQLEVGQDHLDVGIQHWQKLVMRFPQSPAAPLALYGAGSARMKQEKYPEAVQLLSQLQTAYGTAKIAEDGLLLRGLCLQRQNKYTEAIRDLQQYLTKEPAKLAAYDARFTMALCQVGLKQFAPATKSLTDLLQAAPDYKRADRARYELAFAFEALKKPMESQQSFQALVKQHPQSPLAAECWFRIGQFEETAKRLPQALAAFQSGLKSAPDTELHEQLQYKLGWIHYQQATYAEAIKAFAAQLGKAPAGTLAPDATYLTGESHYKLKQYPQAMQRFNEIIKAKSPKFLARALYRNGDCAAQAKQWPASQSHYTTLLGQFPKFERVHEARYGLGLALQNQSKLTEAVKEFEQVTRETQSETAAKSRFMIGECRFGQKNYSDAVEHFLEAALGYPYEEWQALGYYEAARCFIQLKDATRARETLQTVISKYAKHPRAQDAQKLLKTLGTE
ncbi:MAG: tetratricopeptide repeat protein [Planctomycetaceae bacterium]